MQARELMPETPATANAIQEAAELRQKLEQANALLANLERMAALGELLAGIIHEINSPIGSLRSNNEVAVPSLEKIVSLLDTLEAQDSATVHKLRKTVDTLRTLARIDRMACDRISGVIRNLKTFARGDQMDRRLVELHPLIEAAVQLTQCEFKRRVHVVTRFDRDLPPVEGYPEKLSQVFLNLITNASQAIEGQGTLTIETRLEGDSAMISFTDTGHGIDPAHLPRIFQPGFTTKPAGVGTGIGLWLSREIVTEKHKGSIDVESTPGAGTTFRIRLPIRGAGSSAALSDPRTS